MRMRVVLPEDGRNEHRGMGDEQLDTGREESQGR
jgi:hypothetical protein